jgi:hypothetical protein
MQLLNDMREVMQVEQSMFRAQLLKEDISRLERLIALAKDNADPSAFAKQAMVLGWTANDMRTFDLNPELGAFLEIVHRKAHPGMDTEPDDSQIDQAWTDLHKRRMDLLVGCLSRPRLD